MVGKSVLRVIKIPAMPFRVGYVLDMRSLSKVWVLSGSGQRRCCLANSDERWQLESQSKPTTIQLEWTSHSASTAHSAAYWPVAELSAAEFAAELSAAVFPAFTNAAANTTTATIVPTTTAAAIRPAKCPNAASDSAGAAAAVCPSKSPATSSPSPAPTAVAAKFLCWTATSVSERGSTNPYGCGSSSRAQQRSSEHWE